jgi:hypothetical protein
MTGSESTTSLNPDYEKSVNEVYQDFTQHMILTRSYGHNLDILEQTGSAAGKVRVEFREFLDAGDQISSTFPKWIGGNMTESDPDVKHILNQHFNILRPLFIQLCETPQHDAELRDMLPPPIYSLVSTFMSFDSAHSFQRFAESYAEQIPTHEDDFVNWMEIFQQFITPIKSGPASLLNLANTIGAGSWAPTGEMVTCLSSETLDTSLASHRQSQEKLPSWVPIWSKPLATTLFSKHLDKLA